MSRRRITADDIIVSLGNIDEKWYDAALDMTPVRQTEQKRFVGYEMTKLLGKKFLWAFVLVLLIANTLTAWYTAGRTPAAAEPSDTISAFFEAYFEEPEKMDAYYEEIQRFNAEQDRLVIEALHRGELDFEPETLPSVWSDDENYSDRRLFDKLYSAINAAADYPDVMRQVIDRAESNLNEFVMMGIPEDSFTYRYQTKVIRLYESVRDNVRIGVEYTRGWGEYFDYDIVNIYIFFLVLMLGSLVFAEEKQVGFLPVLRVSKNGRGRTAAAKILTSLILTWVLTLVFTATTFAVYGLRLGYSSSYNALQALSEFTLSPYQLTIGGYFAVSVGVKLIVFSVFVLIVMALSTLFYNYILIYISGLGIFGLSFLLYTLKYIDPSNPLKNLNFVAVAAVDPLFSRYRAVSFFGNVLGYVPCMLTVYMIIAAAAVGITVLFFVRSAAEIRPGFIDFAVSSVMTALTGVRARIRSAFRNGRRRGRVYSMSLFAAESYKTLISSRFIIVAVLLLIVKCSYSLNVNAAPRSYSDTVYKEYMTTLEGPLTDEKLDWLEDERGKINDILGKQKQMQLAYVNDKISFDDYRDYLDDYNYAFSRSELLSVIEDHAAYLEMKKESGVDAWFMYDTGWKKLYSGDADLFLYTCILLLLTGSFASEYISRSSSGGFAAILRATKNGRKKTFYAKLISAVTVSGVIAVLFGAVDVAVIFRNFDMPSAAAPLASMRMFSAVGGGISVGGYLALFLTLRLAGALIMSVLVCALSELLCRYIPVLGTCVVLTLLPALFAYFGLPAADKVNFLTLLAGTPLYLESVSASLFGCGWAMMAVWIGAAAVIVLALLAPAKKMFVKG